MTHPAAADVVPADAPVPSASLPSSVPEDDISMEVDHGHLAADAAPSSFTLEESDHAVASIVDLGGNEKVDQSHIDATARALIRAWECDDVQNVFCLAVSQLPAKLGVFVGLIATIARTGGIAPASIMEAAAAAAAAAAAVDPPLGEGDHSPAPPPPQLPVRTDIPTDPAFHQLVASSLAGALARRASLPFSSSSRAHSVNGWHESKQIVLYFAELVRARLVAPLALVPWIRCFVDGVPETAPGAGAHHDTRFHHRYLLHAAILAIIRAGPAFAHAPIDDLVAAVDRRLAFVTGLPIADAEALTGDASAATAGGRLARLARSQELVALPDRRVRAPLRPEAGAPCQARYVADVDTLAEAWLAWRSALHASRAQPDAMHGPADPLVVALRGLASYLALEEATEQPGPGSAPAVFPISLPEPPRVDEYTGQPLPVPVLPFHRSFLIPPSLLAWTRHAEAATVAAERTATRAAGVARVAALRHLRPERPAPGGGAMLLTEDDLAALPELSDSHTRQVVTAAGRFGAGLVQSAVPPLRALARAVLEDATRETVFFLARNRPDCAKHLLSMASLGEAADASSATGAYPDGGDAAPEADRDFPASAAPRPPAPAPAVAAHIIEALVSLALAPPAAPSSPGAGGGGLGLGGAPVDVIFVQSVIVEMCKTEKEALQNQQTGLGGFAGAVAAGGPAGPGATGAGAAVGTGPVGASSPAGTGICSLAVSAIADAFLRDAIALDTVLAHVRIARWLASFASNSEFVLAPAPPAVCPVDAGKRTAISAALALHTRRAAEQPTLSRFSSGAGPAAVGAPGGHGAVVAAAIAVAAVHGLEGPALTACLAALAADLPPGNASPPGTCFDAWQDLLLASMTGAGPEADQAWYSGAAAAAAAATAAADPEADSSDAGLSTRLRSRASHCLFRSFITALIRFGPAERVATVLPPLYHAHYLAPELAALAVSAGVGSSRGTGALAAPASQPAEPHLNILSMFPLVNDLMKQFYSDIILALRQRRSMNMVDCILQHAESKQAESGFLAAGQPVIPSLVLFCGALLQLSFGPFERDPESDPSTNSFESTLPPLTSFQTTVRHYYDIFLDLINAEPAGALIILDLLLRHVYPATALPFADRLEPLPAEQARQAFPESDGVGRASSRGMIAEMAVGYWLDLCLLTPMQAVRFCLVEARPTDMPVIAPYAASGPGAAPEDGLTAGSEGRQRGWFALVYRVGLQSAMCILHASLDRMTERLELTSVSDALCAEELATATSKVAARREERAARRRARLLARRSATAGKGDGDRRKRPFSEMSAEDGPDQGDDQATEDRALFMSDEEGLSDEDAAGEAREDAEDEDADQHTLREAKARCETMQQKLQAARREYRELFVFTFSELSKACSCPNATESERQTAQSALRSLVAHYAARPLLRLSAATSSSPLSSMTRLPEELFWFEHLETLPADATPEALLASPASDTEAEAARLPATCRDILPAFEATSPGGNPAAALAHMLKYAAYLRAPRPFSSTLGAQR
ncbi:hypothetical protein H696_02037 [Fonticula alba]|uniref:Uncharacterized protein n=1 Tax=Fonticula alba TaxID=691883 RepID=A0A058ZAZ2_FONAL|nr:hypothetical protein H696_02037 [Fonticula alba]KCV71088.1 hypothetical protein H696_02037 [Fonticula alba]|eukprot:XP_009494211.1 hypothetical protein H696_02037 [Fonticula alba]